MPPPHPQCSGRGPKECRKFPPHLRSSKTSGTTRIVWGNLTNKQTKLCQELKSINPREAESPVTSQKWAIGGQSMWTNWWKVTIFGLQCCEQALWLFCILPFTTRCHCCINELCRHVLETHCWTMWLSRGQHNTSVKSLHEICNHLYNLTQQLKPSTSDPWTLSLHNHVCKPKLR